MLAGMWGFNNQLDRNFSTSIYNNIIDINIAKTFNPGSANLKGQDQFFLERYVVRGLRKKSIIHDSYLCLMYRDSEPFPTRRVGGCHVGGENAIECQKGSLKDCPVQCRPKNHQDWNAC